MSAPELPERIGVFCNVEMHDGARTVIGYDKWPGDARGLIGTMVPEARLTEAVEALREIAAVKHPNEPPNPYKQIARAALAKLEGKE